MIRAASLSFALLLLVLGGSQGEAEVGKSSNKGGGEGYSQQYHYSSPGHHGGGHHGWTYPALSVDLGTGVFLAVGAISLLLGLIAFSHLFDKKDDNGWGWSGGSGGGASGGGGGGGGGGYRSLDMANLSEKVLQGIEKLYTAYNKTK